MKPHELIKALCQQQIAAAELRGERLSLSAIARSMRSQAFQPTLHKFINGDGQRSPTADSAAHIAAYFGIPLDALFNEKAASQVAAEHGIAPSPPAAVRETLAQFSKSRRHDATLSPSTLARVAALSPRQLANLERIVNGYLDDISVSVGTHGKEHAA